MNQILNTKRLFSQNFIKSQNNFNWTKKKTSPTYYQEGAGQIPMAHYSSCQSWSSGQEYQQQKHQEWSQCYQQVSFKNDN